MTDTSVPSRPPIRLWPGVVAVAVQWIARFGVKAVVSGFPGFALAMQWALGAAAAVWLWWLLFSRARWFERLGAFALAAAGLGLAWQLRHPSMSLVWLLGYALPWVCLALVVGVAVSRGLADGPRRAVAAAILLASCLSWTLLRTDGVNGDHQAMFAWRWTPSSEEALLGEAPTPGRLAQPASAPSAPAATAAPAGTESPEPRAEKSDTSGREVKAPAPSPAAPSPASNTAAADWPGFRGAGRDGIVPGVTIRTDWSTSPPVALWRRPVGPGWSSFAVSGGLLYTQEQRGSKEVVACYELATGAPVWMHEDEARFFESNAGAGPRGTPTLADGRVYTFGATGLLNALDAATGEVVWARDAAADGDGTTPARTTAPTWGFSSSPLVVDDLVIVAVSGQLRGYDRGTGVPQWFGPKGGVSYSSPQLATIGGTPQVVLANARGLTSVAPADGRVLWQHAWGGFPMVQPVVTPAGDVFVSVGADSGLRRLAVGPKADEWAVEERWTTNALKPYFNDFVIHRGHAYGFDGRILSCVDLRDGQRKWKGGRYGNGQLVLLEEQDLVLVLSEEGELALVKATPEAFSEVARVPAIEGKTWNHPVLVGDRLLVRNAEQMAAFRLARAGH
jgi:hypothetical protein